MAGEHQGSKKDVSETWTVRLPFHLSPGKAISLDGQVHQGQIDGQEYSITGEGRHYVLKVWGFPDRESAEMYVQRLGGGLLWTRATVRTGIQFDLHVDEAKYFDDAKAAARNIFGEETKRLVDCVIDGKRTSVYPSDKQIATITASAPGILLSVQPSRFMSALEEGVCTPNAAKLVKNKKVTLASEVYSLSHFESSPGSTFLGQMTVLEILAERPKQAKEVLDLIGNWAQEIKDAKDAATSEDVVRSLERLQNDLGYLKKESITESVRLLVCKSLKYLKDPKLSELVDRVRPLYKTRSNIVHGRTLELGQAPSQLQDIVSKTLLAVMSDPSLLDVPE